MGGAHVSIILVWKTYLRTRKHVTYAGMHARITCVAILGSAPSTRTVRVCVRMRTHTDAHGLLTRWTPLLHRRRSPRCRVYIIYTYVHGHAWIHRPYARYTNCSRGLTRSATAVSRKEEKGTVAVINKAPYHLLHTDKPERPVMRETKVNFDGHYPYATLYATRGRERVSSSYTGCISR